MQEQTPFHILTTVNLHLLTPEYAQNNSKSLIYLLSHMCRSPDIQLLALKYYLLKIATHTLPPPSQLLHTACGMIDMHSTFLGAQEIF